MVHRITIVDDESDVRSALRRLFKLADMNTQSYASAGGVSGCTLQPQLRLSDPRSRAAGDKRVGVAEPTDRQRPAIIVVSARDFIADPMERGGKIGLATIRRDIRERKRIEEGLRQADAKLAHVSRLASMGELCASIAHEVNQPLSAVVANANACARMLDAQPLDLEEVRRAVSDIAASGIEASEIIRRIRGQMKKSDSRRHKLSINGLIPGNGQRGRPKGKVARPGALVNRHISPEPVPHHPVLF